MTVDELIIKLEEIREQYSGDWNVEKYNNVYGYYEPTTEVKIVSSAAQWVVGIS